MLQKQKKKRKFLAKGQNKAKEKRKFSAKGRKKAKEKKIPDQDWKNTKENALPWVELVIS